MMDIEAAFNEFIEFPEGSSGKYVTTHSGRGGCQFENMPPMQKDGEEVIVKCTGFVRREDK